MLTEKLYHFLTKQNSSQLARAEFDLDVIPALFQNLNNPNEAAIFYE